MAMQDLQYGSDLWYFTQAITPGVARKQLELSASVPASILPDGTSSITVRPWSSMAPYARSVKQLAQVDGSDRGQGLGLLLRRAWDLRRFASILCDDHRITSPAAPAAPLPRARHRRRPGRPAGLRRASGSPTREIAMRDDELPDGYLTEHFAR